MSFHTIPHGRVGSAAPIELNTTDDKLIVAAPPPGTRRLVGGQETSFGQAVGPYFHNDYIDSIDPLAKIVTPDGTFIVQGNTLGPQGTQMYPIPWFMLKDDEELRAIIDSFAGAGPPVMRVFPGWLDVPGYTLGRTRVAVGKSAPVVVVPEPAPGRTHTAFGIGEQPTFSWVGGVGGDAQIELRLVDIETGTATPFGQESPNDGTVELVELQPVVARGQQLEAIALDTSPGTAVFFGAYLIK